VATSPRDRRARTGETSIAFFWRSAIRLLRTPIRNYGELKRDVVEAAGRRVKAPEMTLAVPN
jgi:hypothetical protein